jgi:protein TonB
MATHTFKSAPSRFVVVAGVLLLHVLALWALQSGLLMRVWQEAEILVPVAQLAELPTPPKPPVVEPSKPTKPTLQATPSVPPPPIPAPAPAPAPVAPVAAPAPLAVADAPPAANAATGTPTPRAAPVVVAAPVPAPVPVRVELPSSDANYLHNPVPVYPAASERRRESGLVLLSVLVDAEGRAKAVSIKTSSGFERLDQSALQAVTGWTFVPGKRNGVPVEMTVDVPIRFKSRE